MLVAALPSSAAAQTGAWSRAVTAVGSQPLDVGPLMLAGGPSSVEAIGFALGDVDSTGSSDAMLLTGRGARFGRGRRIAGAQSVLAARYLSHRLVVLLGGAPSSADCCSTVTGLAVGGGRLRAGRPFLSGLDGPAQAELVPDGKRLLAVVATDRGVWAALSSADGRRFGAPRRLTTANASPQSLAAVPAGSGGVTVAWSARTGGLTSDGPTEIVAAGARAGQLPGRARVAVRMAGGHAVDELALTPAKVPELAWIESSVDRSGVFRSVVHAAPLGSGKVSGRVLSSAGTLAGGLSAAGGAGATVLVAWRGCNTTGTCSAQAAVGAARSRRAPAFGRPRTLGRIDTDQVPAAAVSAGRAGFVGWIGSGAARAARVSGGRFGKPSVLARSSYLTGLAMGASGSGGALAAWVDGTARQRVVVSGWSGH